MTEEEKRELIAQIDELFRQRKSSADVIRLTSAPYLLVQQRRKNVAAKEDRKARRVLHYLKKLSKLRQALRWRTRLRLQRRRSRNEEGTWPNGGRRPNASLAEGRYD